MATIKLNEISMNTYGKFPEPGSQAPDFLLTDEELMPVKLNDFSNEIVVLNSYPSIDTTLCFDSIQVMMRKAENISFLRKIVSKKRINILCISMDLPFSLKRTLLDEERHNNRKKPEHIKLLSDFRTRDFGSNYGVTIMDGLLAGLLARSIIILDKNHTIAYSQLLSDLSCPPDFQAAMDVIKRL